MTSPTIPATRDLAQEFAEQLVDSGYGAFFCTPCGVLAPLLTELGRRTEVRTIPREDNAVGVAAGAALAGTTPVVLMQNSGFGQSINALASLAVPYRIPVLLVISMRGRAPDNTPENAAMGRLTEPVLDELGIPATRLPRDAGLRGFMDCLNDVVQGQRRTAAVLIDPDTFGWQV